MNIEINYSGKESTFSNLNTASSFCERLESQGIGYDIWMDGELHLSVIYNVKTYEFIRVPGNKALS